MLNCCFLLTQKLRSPARTIDHRSTSFRAEDQLLSSMPQCHFYYWTTCTWLPSPSVITRNRRKVTKMRTLTLKAIKALYNVGVAQRVFFEFAKKHVAVGSLPNAGCGTLVDLRWFILMMTFEDITEARW